MNIDFLASIICSHAKQMRSSFDEEELVSECGDSGMDCQLRLFQGEYSFHLGDGQYLSDLRGTIASGFIPYECDKECAKEIAKELLEYLEEYSC